MRPCKSSLGPDLHARWQAHLCGLCLTLREVGGQAERVLTGYDVLLLSVLVEAQAGQVETTTAAPCPLRGFTRATVVASTSDAGRLAAAGALLTAGAGLTDKADDGDVPRAARPATRRVAGRLARLGVAVAERVGLDAGPVLAAPAAAARAEATDGATLEQLLAPAGAAVAALFAHTAVVAQRPENAGDLADCGDAFGRLVHLLDAAEDRGADAAAGRFNPLTATGTGDAAARALAQRLLGRIDRALNEAAFADRALVDVLLGREPERAVHRVLGGCVSVPGQRAPSSAGLLAAMALLLPAVFIGGTSGGCGGGGRRRSRYGYGGYPLGGGGYPAAGYDPYGYPYPRRRRPSYGYAPQPGLRVVGPGCGQLLACNCCANLACNACCCGSQCANG